MAGIIFGELADSPIVRDVFNRRTPRLIDGCERLLELQLTCKRKQDQKCGKVRKVWMYLKWRAVCKAIIFTSKFGHHSLEKNCEIENTVSCGMSLYCCWPCPSKDISRMCPVLSCMFPVLSVHVVNLLCHSFSHRDIVYYLVRVPGGKLLAILNLAIRRQIRQITN